MVYEKLFRRVFKSDVVCHGIFFIASNHRSDAVLMVTLAVLQHRFPGEPLKQLRAGILTQLQTSADPVAGIVSDHQELLHHFHFHSVDKIAERHLFVTPKILSKRVRFYSHHAREIVNGADTGEMILKNFFYVDHCSCDDML